MFNQFTNGIIRHELNRFYLAFNPLCVDRSVDGVNKIHTVIDRKMLKNSEIITAINRFMIVYFVIHPLKFVQPHIG